MRNDKTTFKDLSIFSSEGNNGVISLIVKTTSDNGKSVLQKYVSAPPDSFEQLQRMQASIKYWSSNLDKWPTIITNGTLVMLEKYFEAADEYTSPPSGFTLFFGDFWQKFFNKGAYFFTQFSISHIADFLKGCQELVGLLSNDDLPELLKTELMSMKQELDHHLTAELIKVTKETSYKQQAKLSFLVRREMKSNIHLLMQHYARLDAWQSMARATVENRWVFPDLLQALPVHFEAEGLVHPLLKEPKPYDINFSNDKNFLILTGANMSGKTTFMRSIGVAAILAHLGMGVPAQKLRISFFKGVITNMHVEDDLLKGESYFYAEVKRMKMTAEKLVEHEPHLVLMDELFKGTNVHDAYDCTSAVVEGLLHKHEHLMILSTHLYEVAKKFKERNEVQFVYFSTQMTGDDNYSFNYELKEGISNDRIGYRILQKEGVIGLLKGKA